jgi:hypothetical protein
MGIRIHKMIGYGCSAEEFQNKTGYNTFSDELYEIFNNIKSLNVPDSLHIYRQGKNILTDYHDKNKINGTDLFHVSGYDDPDHICFIPSADYADWYRYDDIMDYIMASFIEDGKYNPNKGAYDNIIYIQKDIYPFSDIPETIIWYLEHLQIMPEHVSKSVLKPLYMEWWA